MGDFKSLPIEEALTKLNNHLLSLKSMNGRLEDNFKTGEFDFSYSLLKKSSKILGIEVDGKNYKAYRISDAIEKNIDEKNSQENVNVKQNIVNTSDDNKTVDDKDELLLNNEEILFIKQLYMSEQNLVKAQQEVVSTKQVLIVPKMSGKKKTTGVSVYVDVWERWGEFKKKHSMYSGTDLLAMAIEEFMKRYDDDAGES